VYKEDRTQNYQHNVYCMVHYSSNEKVVMSASHQFNLSELTCSSSNNSSSSSSSSSSRTVVVVISCSRHRE